MWIGKLLTSHLSVVERPFDTKERTRRNRVEVGMIAGKDSSPFSQFLSLNKIIIPNSNILISCKNYRILLIFFYTSGDARDTIIHLMLNYLKKINYIKQLLKILYISNEILLHHVIPYMGAMCVREMDLIGSINNKYFISFN